MAKKAEKNLVIVESPAKAKTIGKYLGPSYQVKACMGHLRDLPKSKLGVDVDNDFEPDYRPIKGKEDIIRDLRAAADESAAVYLATDPDREGEAISWHLKYLLELPDERAHRVTFNEITQQGRDTRASPPHARSTRTSSTRSRRAAFSTVSSATSSRRCCGRRSAGACPRAVCSRSRCVWSPTARKKSATSCRRNTGRSTPCCETTRASSSARTTTGRAARSTSRSRRPISSGSNRSCGICRSRSGA